MIKKIILFVLIYAALITIITLTVPQDSNTYLIVITVSGLLLGVLVMREVYKKYFTALPKNQNIVYSSSNHESLNKISQRPFLFGLEKKIISEDDFYFDDQFFYAINKNNQAAKFSLTDITELGKTSYQINNSRIWQVKINNHGEELLFKFAHNYSVWNRNFLLFYDKLKEINPSAIRSEWNSWSM